MEKKLKTDKDYGKDAPYHMALLWYVHLLNDIIRPLNQAWIYNDHQTIYRMLRLLYRRTFFKMDMEERAEIDKHFKHVGQNLSAPQLRGREARQFQSETSGKIADELDTIELLITTAMDKRGMIFPRVELKEGLDDIRQYLGIGKHKEEGELDDNL